MGGWICVTGPRGGAVPGGLEGLGPTRIRWRLPLWDLGVMGRAESSTVPHCSAALGGQGLRIRPCVTSGPAPPVCPPGLFGTSAPEVGGRGAPESSTVCRRYHTLVISLASPLPRPSSSLHLHLCRVSSILLGLRPAHPPFIAHPVLPLGPHPHLPPHPLVCLRAFLQHLLLRQQFGSAVVVLSDPPDPVFRISSPCEWPPPPITHG